MLLTGFMSMQFLSVPMIMVFKNTTNVLIVSGEWYLYGQEASVGVMVSIVVMVLGAVLAAHEDLSFNATGYLWMGLNCCSTAGYVLYMRKVTSSIKLSKFSAVFINNFLCCIMLTMTATATGELQRALEAVVGSERSLDYRYLVLNGFTGVIAFLMNFASLWCIACTSGTTYSIIGSLNKVPVTLLGVVLFDARLTFEQALFVVMSMLGGFGYSYAKVMDMRRR
mmetsp:Transcript_49687/g.140698  ORF Transcript_49687/g.140698 Transcript_49687/m.140698 type:complete len:224 (-) Transcript_49687:215-886(-)